MRQNFVLFVCLVFVVSGIAACKPSSESDAPSTPPQAEESAAPSEKMIDDNTSSDAPTAQETETVEEETEPEEKPKETKKSKGKRKKATTK
jgi:hypothetical protein